MVAGELRSSYIHLVNILLMPTVHGSWWLGTWQIDAGWQANRCYDRPCTCSYGIQLGAEMCPHVPARARVTNGRGPWDDIDFAQLNQVSSAMVWGGPGSAAAFGSGSRMLLKAWGQSWTTFLLGKCPEISTSHIIIYRGL